VIDLRADLHNVADPERLRQTDPRVAATTPPAPERMWNATAARPLAGVKRMSSAKTASSTLGDDVCASRDKPDLNTRGMRVGVRPGDSRRLHPDIGSAKE